jgi:hypothetical protein
MASRANRSVSSEPDQCQSGYVPPAHPLTAAHPTVMRGQTIGSVRGPGLFAGQRATDPKEVMQCVRL